jgi:enoyl-CoA hydratase
MTGGAEGRVVVRREGTVGHITLDRPEAINALRTSMVLRMQRAFDTWRDDRRVTTILIDGRGERGFCAGGDIRFVHRSILEDESLVHDLWQAQYRLDVTVAEYDKPVVTVADGVTMGGGVGLASHASHRVVTARSRLGMPEVGIGLAPDVGGLLLLSRAPGETGTHAALTGAVLNAADALGMGLADYVLPAHEVAGLASRLQDTGPTTLLAGLHAPAEAGPPDVLSQRAWIDECYSFDDPVSVLRALQSHADPRARAAAEVIISGSPTALAVTLEGLRRAARMARVRECFVQDYRVSCRFLDHPDLLEGIRARLVDRDQSPRWSPTDVAALDRATLERFFEPLADELVLDAPCAQVRLSPRA